MKATSGVLKGRFAVVLDIIIAIITFFIFNRRTWLCLDEINKPLFYCQYGTLQSENLVLLLLVAATLLLLWQRRELRTFFASWKSHWLLIAFLVWAAASYFWSIDSAASLEKIPQLVLTTLLAAYFGYRFSQKRILIALFMFSFIVTALSFVLVGLLPGAAIMSTYPHEGIWRGITSHRNYLGSLAAFSSMIALMVFFRKKRFWQKLLAVAIFAGCGFLIFKSHSATGILLMAGLNLVVLLCLGWVHVWPRMKTWQKISVLAGSGVVLVLAVLNLNHIFALVGRNSSLTGRIPLWGYLIQDVANHNLWLGYGIGSVWNMGSYMQHLADVLGWPFLVVNGHNGFVDIFVYLGLVGVLMLIAITATVLIRSFIHFVGQKSTLSLLPFVSILYVIVANITISYFFVFETFHWAILVCFLFAASRKTLLIENPG